MVVVISLAIWAVVPGRVLGLICSVYVRWCRFLHSVVVTCRRCRPAGVSVWSHHDGTRQLRVSCVSFTAVRSVSTTFVIAAFHSRCGHSILPQCCISLSFTARRNARIASAVLATAIPSACPSVRPSVTRRYCVKTTARSTVQFALLDSKMCLVL